MQRIPFALLVLALFFGLIMVHPSHRSTEVPPDRDSALAARTRTPVVSIEFPLNLYEHLSNTQVQYPRSESDSLALAGVIKIARFATIAK